MCGRPVTLSLWVRKFFCEQAMCPRKIFAQQAESVLKPHARHLQRVEEQAQALGLLIGSKPGARVCQMAGIPLSASTLLRIMKITPMPEVVTPAVLGVDDFAFHKRTRYGTILVDLEKRRPVDLLPDREGKTLETWLQAHTGVSIAVRDRSPVYANAIARVCPAAKQVADAWHLLKNLSENIEKYLDTKATIIRQLAREVAAEEAEKLKKPVGTMMRPNPKPHIGKTGTMMAQHDRYQIAGITLQPAPALEITPTEKRHDTYHQVKQLQSLGYGKKAIARQLKISRNTVRKYFRQQIFVPRPIVKRSNLLEFEAYLHQQWQQGNTCGRKLLEELRAMGYNGSYTILAVFLSAFRQGKFKQTRLPLPFPIRAARYSSRRMSVALCLPESEWTQKEKPLLKSLLEKLPFLDQVRNLSLEFKAMLMLKRADQLQNWCQQASQLACFKGFVFGIKQDFNAVYQAMNTSWSNGQVEGQVNRLKTIKRQMYGRASFELLRIRVLAGNCTNHRE